MLGTASSPLIHWGTAFWARAFIACALLSGCGGGGGGGSGGANGDAYSLSTGTVAFSAVQGGSAPSPQTVAVTVNFGNVFIATTQSGGQFSHVFNITGQTTGEIIITPFAPTTAGSSSGTITVRGCSTQTCVGGDVPGSPKTITVGYTVTGQPTLTSTPSSVDFQATAGNPLPAAKTVELTFSGPGPNVGWTRSIAFGGTSSGWLDVLPTAGTTPQPVTFSVIATPAAGVHTANVTFTAGSATRVVPVSLTVSDPRVTSLLHMWRRAVYRGP